MRAGPAHPACRSAGAMSGAPASRKSEMARLRTVAMTWGPAPRRIWERSSSNVTSRTQCSRFSMVQWARTSARRRAGDAWAGGRLVTP